MAKRSQSPYVSGYKATKRDKVVVFLSNWMLSTFATDAYLSYLYVVMMFGREEFHRRFTETLEEKESSNG